MVLLDLANAAHVHDAADVGSHASTEGRGLDYVTLLSDGHVAARVLV